ncbi:hypothetical protein C8J56DRAFT_883750 [Mycena floridula]|nr:hypothetical protein C8J56DRAFT_883750 [Mycena floridula]
MLGKSTLAAAVTIHHDVRNPETEFSLQDRLGERQAAGFFFSPQVLGFGKGPVKSVGLDAAHDPFATHPSDHNAVFDPLSSNRQGIKESKADHDPAFLPVIPMDHHLSACIPSSGLLSIDSGPCQSGDSTEEEEEDIEYSINRSDNHASVAWGKFVDGLGATLFNAANCGGAGFCGGGNGGGCGGGGGGGGCGGGGGGGGCGGGGGRGGGCGGASYWLKSYGPVFLTSWYLTAIIITKFVHSFWPPNFQLYFQYSIIILSPTPAISDEQILDKVSSLEPHLAIQQSDYWDEIRRTLDAE